MVYVSISYRGKFFLYKGTERRGKLEKKNILE